MLSLHYGWTPQQIGRLTFFQFKEYLKGFYSEDEETPKRDLMSEARGFAAFLKQARGLGIKVPPNIIKEDKNETG